MSLIWKFFIIGFTIVLSVSWYFSICEARKILDFLHEITIAEILQLPLSIFFWIPLIVIWILGNIVLTAFLLVLLLGEWDNK